MNILASVDVFGRRVTGTHRTVEHEGDLYLVIYTADDGSHLALKLDRSQIVDFPAEFKLAVPMYKGTLSLSDVAVIPN